MVGPEFDGIRFYFCACALKSSGACFADSEKRKLNSNLKSFNSNIKNLIDRKKLMLESISSNLKAISPLAVLDRGYAIVMNESGQALKSSKELKVGDAVTTRLADGGFSSNVSKKN